LTRNFCGGFGGECFRKGTNVDYREIPTFVQKQESGAYSPERSRFKLSGRLLPERSRFKKPSNFRTTSGEGLYTATEKL
jgi:hypothetical protein